MKQWEADDPKAKVMTRKRAAILGAARQEFLKSGYEGASMEAIAAASGVSIATLYRHAASKDDVFSAVIANACDPDDEAEQAEMARLMEKPLAAILVAFAIFAQQMLASADTVALMRTVMAEAIRFPHLAEMAYRGFVGHLEVVVEGILAAKEEGRRLTRSQRHQLSVLFVDRLFGSDIMRVLLGLSGASKAQRQSRAERARDDMMDRLVELRSGKAKSAA